MKTIQQKKDTVTKAILKDFSEKYPHLEPQHDFETVWPISAWDLLHTETRSFEIKLKLSTGKVLSIDEIN